MDDHLDRADADVLDRAQRKVNRFVVRGDLETHIARVHIGRQNFETHASRIADEQSHIFDVAGFGDEQRTFVLDGIVRLEVRCLTG